MNTLYLTRLGVDKFPNDTAVCLGSQLQSILKLLSSNRITYTWYTTDIEALASLPEELMNEGSNLKHIGQVQDLIQLVGQVDQFLSGVFLGVSDELLPNIAGHSYYTEDVEFRDIYPAEIEIRCFDTSFFEIYSFIEENLLDISAKYKAQIVSRNISQDLD